MKKFFLFSISFMLCCYLYAQPLAGTDGLGRTLIQNKEAGDVKSNRRVGMFYFLWQGDKGSPTAPVYWDLDEISRNSPEVFEKQNHTKWGGKIGDYYFWGKPIYGYYKGDDYWVHLRSIQLLTDAGVDFLVIDATNRNTYPVQSDALMRAIEAVRKQGKNPPKIVYYTNTQSGATMQEVYDFYYKEGAPYRYPGCWFYLDGKPLILGVSKEAAGTNYEKFFTIRESQWPTVPQIVDGWPWISFKRIPEVHYNHRGEREILNVSVAQHPNPTAGMGGSAFYGNMDNWGRSYRSNSHGNPETDIAYGYNFQEQWDYALKEDVPFIFVTGWNEWIAGRWKSHDSNPEHSWFCDQANPEYSRDIEPSLSAGLKDNYYMQLVNNIRRYKGLEKNLPVQNFTIKQMKDWDKIPVMYTDYTGDTEHRNHPGAQTNPQTVYTNNTGRNDFHMMKAAHNTGNLYFYAETVQDITAPSGDNWMTLWIDADKNAKTGWHGYDYRIVQGNILQQYSGGSWQTVNAKQIKYTVEKNKMMITVPRRLLSSLSTPVAFEFKWSDNMQTPDPLDWYISGDAAPGGRFNCQYIAGE
ncbi:MAG: hypothetical protein J0I84_03710 [Terrimonas sp.]|nr:hypothetical protein [Terrimonas sp.]OJY88157.1 MAG: hypothetical protein BGP13_06300 [Sphingobacteriales bacterium 40-81]